MTNERTVYILSKKKEKLIRKSSRRRRRKKRTGQILHMYRHLINSLNLYTIFSFLSFIGTLISAFAVFCCGKHDHEKNIVAFFYNLLAAILQSATIFILVGWIWSIRWGILFVQLSGKKMNRFFVDLFFLCKKKCMQFILLFETKSVRTI